MENHHLLHYCFEKNMPNAWRNQCWITATIKLLVVEIYSTMILMTTAAKKSTPFVNVVIYVYLFVSVVTVKTINHNNY